MSYHRPVVAFHKASLLSFPDPSVAREILEACPVRAHFTVSTREQIELADSRPLRGNFMLYANGNGIDEALNILRRQSLGSPVMVISACPDIRAASENEGFHAYDFATPALAEKIREFSCA